MLHSDYLELKLLDRSIFRNMENVKFYYKNSTESNIGDIILSQQGWLEESREILFTKLYCVEYIMALYYIILHSSERLLMQV